MSGDAIKILAIDDEAGFVDMLKQYFESRDYEIDISSDGEEGLGLYRDKRHDVILIDLKLADLGGDELMKRIKEINAGANAIVITGYKDSGQARSRLLGQGAYAYLEKPVSSLKELEKLIVSAANRGKGGSR